MTREEILDKIEAIQERNYNEFKGSNEVELHIREDVADLIEEMLQASGELSRNESCDLDGVSNTDILYVVELSDEELKIVSESEIEEWYKSAEDFDGFLGFSIKGKLIN